MKEINIKPYRDPTHYYDFRIALILFVFLSVWVVSVLLAASDSESFFNKQTCQQLDISRSQLVSVDCEVIVDNPVVSNSRSTMAVFLFKPIPINDAGFELLQTVKGVGPKLAEKIITYRQQIGPFIGPESIKQLTGVGEKRAQYLATQFSFN